MSAPSSSPTPENPESSRPGPNRAAQEAKLWGWAAVIAAVVALIGWGLWQLRPLLATAWLLAGLGSAPSPAPAAPPPADTGVLAKQRAVNDGLEQQIAKLQEKLNGDFCAPDDINFVPANPIPPSGIQGAVTPPPANNSSTGTQTAAISPPSAASLKPRSNADLVKLLENATALVVTPSGTASGFFIAPDLLMTNRHAVDGAKPDEVFIVGRNLGSVHRGSIIARTSTGPTGSPDFALIKVANVTAPATLSFSRSVQKLESVVAAGYPGLSLLNDKSFRDLLGGNKAAAPDLVITRGEVNSIQQNALGLPTIAHTASIMPGNSGGPLVDPCGRVIGINTYVVSDKDSPGLVGFAVASDALLSFLASHGARMASQDEACGG